eukprot:m51a1_g10655 hypothetical protein (458) ;mRNA; f:19175-28289
MGVLDYTFNQVRYLLSMSGLWPKNQDLIGTTLLLHINKNNVMLGILGMLVHCGFVDEVFLYFQQPGHTHNDLDQCFSSPSNYFKANNVMSLPEVPEVFTSSWANREFLRSFRVQVSDLKCCYMLANYFESSLINYSSLTDLFGFHVYEKNPDITLLGRFVSWLTNAARWKWVRGGMNQKDIIEMAMAHKCTKGAAEVAKLARAELTAIQAAQTEGDRPVDDRFHVIDEEEDVMSSQAPVPSPAPKKKKKKVSTGHAEELPPSMSLNQINAQYKFGEVTDISFGDIFGHVFERVIGVQAVAQQYMAAKKHGRSTMFEQEIPVIRYGSGSNASYLQLDHNHRIISILFIHVMEHYNFQLPAISDAMAASSSFWRMLCLIPIHVTVYRSTMPVPLIMYFGKAINEITTAARHETWIDQLVRIAHLSHTCVKENFFAKFMNAIDRIDPSSLVSLPKGLLSS